MSKQMFNRAKNAILGEIKKALPGIGMLEIKVEARGGVEYFEQALQDPEVQEALRGKKLSATIQVIDPLSIVKAYVLRSLKSVVRGETKPVVFQVLEQDADLYYVTLKLPEVIKEIERKNLKIEFQIIGKTGRVKSDIVIATIDDVTSGELDNLL